MSSPVERYVPFHKRSPSASSMTLSTSPVLSYTRDELLALAPSTSTSHTTDVMTHPTMEHTYLHPQPHNGCAALNTAMRSYLRHACPEIVMNRRMRKSVEYQQFQHRTSARAGSPSASDRARSRSPSARSSASDVSSSSSRSKPVEATLPSKPQPAVQPATIKPVPASIKKRTTPRRTRSGTTTSTARSRFNSFNAFHKQLAGSGVDSQWRRPVATPLPVAAH